MLSPGFAAILRLAFSDIVAVQCAEDVLFSPEHASAIVEFVERWRHADRLVVHCHAGLSRSPGVALGLCDRYGWPVDAVEADYPDIVGGSLGFLYAPCAGPILAAVVSVSASQGSSLEILAIALAFSAGSAAVLLVFALGGPPDRRAHPRRGPWTGAAACSRRRDDRHRGR